METDVLRSYASSWAKFWVTGGALFPVSRTLLLTLSFRSDVGLFRVLRVLALMVVVQSCLIGCSSEADDDSSVSSPTPGDPDDKDGDHYTPAEGDCDDHDASIHPGAPESCDAKDNDCNGDADDNVGTIWYADADDDGYVSLSQPACTSARVM